MRRPAALVVAALLVLAACSDGSGKWGPGTVTATLESPNGSEGAAVLLLLGEGVGPVRSLGETEAHSRAGADGLRVVLVDRTGGTLSFEVTIGDVRRLPLAVVEQVAGPSDALRTDLSGYSVEFGR